MVIQNNQKDRFKRQTKKLKVLFSLSTAFISSVSFRSARIPNSIKLREDKHKNSFFFSGRTTKARRLVIFS